MHLTTSIALLFTAAVSFVYGSENIIRVPLIAKGRRFEAVTTQQRVSNWQDPYQAALYNEERSGYLVDVGIGTPEQNFFVVVDTGSADLWVPSIECPPNNCPVARFNPAQSSTFRSTNSKFRIVYGSGAVNGTYVTDTVTIAGASIQNQQFGLVSSTADLFSGRDNSNSKPSLNGILGLAYPKLTAAHDTGGPEYTPFVFNLAEQHLISQPIFSIYMNSPLVQDWAGEIIFGGVDNSKFTGELLYVPVAGEMAKPSNNPLEWVLDGSAYTYTFWTVYGQGVAVETPQATTGIVAFDSATPFIIDTGTTLTFLPEDVTYRVARELVGEGNFQLDKSGTFIRCNCRASNAGTALQLQISSSGDMLSPPVLLSVPVSELVIPIDASTVQEANSCILGITPSSKNAPQEYLIGDSVLRSAYLAFDMGQDRIGFATAKNVPGSVRMGALNPPGSIVGVSGL
ncbi:aspartic peptidase domain-containing protein [Fennellomyces sp. T-0311]|nr:aspartic peptidase domain-containing protein [Fennellomyces sp. T-0311]